jgi:hypothetical protein
MGHYITSCVILCAPQKILFGCFNKDEFGGQDMWSDREQKKYIHGIGEEI